MTELEALDKNKKDEEFLLKFDAKDYTAQAKKAKDEILESIRWGVVRETGRASILGSKKAKKMRSFLEVFIQGLTQ